MDQYKIIVLLIVGVQFLSELYQMSNCETYQKILETIEILEMAIRNPPIEYSKREIEQKLSLAKQFKIIYQPKNGAC